MAAPAVKKQKSDAPAFSTVLIAGALKFPKGLDASDKLRDPDHKGNAETSIQLDIDNMVRICKRKPGYGVLLQDGVLRATDTDRETVLNVITTAAKTAKRGVVIYYTGFGQKDSGNWCFTDGVISVNDVVDTVRKVNKRLYIDIYADCSYAGNWAEDVKCYEGKDALIFIYAATVPGQQAHDSEDGGVYTMFITEKKRPADFHDLPKLERCYGRIDLHGNFGLQAL